MYLFLIDPDASSLADLDKMVSRLFLSYIYVSWLCKYDYNYYLFILNRMNRIGFNSVPHLISELIIKYT